MAVFRWGEWAEAIMQIITEVKPGENLLIMADTWTDMEIAEAVLIAGINAKTNAQLLVIPRRTRADASEVNASTAGAIMGADVIVGLCGSMSNIKMRLATEKARAKGTRVAQASVRGVEDWAIEGLIGLDYRRMIEVAEKIGELYKKTEVVRLTSAVGTDVSFQVGDRPIVLGDGRAVEPGQVGYFPGATPGIAPIEETVNGTIVVDGATSLGLVSAPVTLRVEKGVVTSIEGGEDANAYRSLLESVDDPKAFNVVHFNVGVNPRAQMQDRMHQNEQVVGAVTFGFGHQDPSFQGSAGAAKIHSDVVLRSPTIYLDDVVMCENNQLNPDLGLGGI